MLHDEPNYIVENCNKDAISKHLESEFSYSLGIEHHVESSRTNSQIEEIRSKEHHKACDHCIEH
jgi:hypothetical protein